MNITRDDIVGLCGLSEPEVAAIAEHEHIPEVAAAALANYLTHKKGGIKEIRQIIADDIRAALDRGDAHAAELFMALQHLHEEYGAQLPPDVGTQPF